MPVKKKSVKSSVNSKSKSPLKAGKPKLPAIKHQFIPRPDAEQLAILEKAIYHSFKLTFTADANGAFDSIR